MKNNSGFTKEIVWYNIDIKGNIEADLKRSPGVYIYKFKFNDDTRYYVGSSNKLATRTQEHRSRAAIWADKNKKTLNGSPIFYNTVNKYGWKEFKFGVLKYLDQVNTLNIKKTLLDIEQYYLDNINPSLNVCKVASSPLGIKRSKIFSKNLSKAKRGISLGTKNANTNNKPKIVTSETKLKLSKRCRGIGVKVFDQSNNLLYKFSSLAKAAKHFGVDSSTIGNIHKKGISYDNYIYTFEIKDIRVSVYNYDKELIKIFNNLKEVSLFYHIPYTTLYRFILSGKLYKNLYYFCNKNNNNLKENLLLVK